MNRVKLAQIALRLKQDYGAQQVWVFGSCARGEADEGSDIDLLVISPTSERYFHRAASVKRLLRSERGGMAISPIVLTPQELDARLAIGDQFIGDILAHGIEL
jgi:predicted nucleotidyltransferase